MRKFIPSEEEIYHVFNRGTDKRNTFLNKKDYERFIVNLILFNTIKEPIRNISRYNIDIACKKIPNNSLVKIHAFSLLPNHFHLILEQVEKNGIARFLHRIEMGYSHYFNKINSRSGNLFQGAYKIIHINNDSYRLYLPLYIHLNPLDLLETEKNWKEKGIRNKIKAVDFLKNYSWSSLGEYLKIRSLPFVSRDIFDSLYRSPQEWEDALKDWLPDHIQMCTTNVHHSVVHI
ncbi:MAG: transposase [Candidatus Terrybacteria bacterium]|nr:transposase [Candidatus Terrybacteria bacterium]